VGAASDGAMAIDEALAKKPDILLLDLSLPKIHGLHVLTQLSTLKKTRVIILTGQTDRASVLEALRHGARGYILKDSPRVELIAAIRAVAKGELFVSPQFEKFLREHAVNATRGVEVRKEELTIRERMVLQMIAAGNSNETIAALLGISSRTVEKHRANFMAKLGLESHREIVLYAMREGLLNATAQTQSGH
jgi:DNA-binding NarL/FixJ family response regulator